MFTDALGNPIEVEDEIMYPTPRGPSVAQFMRGIVLAIEPLVIDPTSNHPYRGPRQSDKDQENPSLHDIPLKYSRHPETGRVLREYDTDRAFHIHIAKRDNYMHGRPYRTTWVKNINQVVVITPLVQNV